MPDVRNSLPMVAGAADSPIRKATSILPLESASAASSPPMSSNFVAPPGSMPLALSKVSASTSEPLPCNPMAILLPGNSASRDTTLHKGDIDTASGIDQLMQIVERAFRRHDLHRHAITRKNLLVALGNVPEIAVLRPGRNRDGLGRCRMDQPDRQPDADDDQQDHRSETDSQVTPGDGDETRPYGADGVFMRGGSFFHEGILPPSFLRRRKPFSKSYRAGTCRST